MARNLATPMESMEPAPEATGEPIPAAPTIPSSTPPAPQKVVDVGEPPGQAVQVRVASSVALASWGITALFLAVGAGFQIVNLLARLADGSIFGLQAGRLQAIALAFGLVGLFLLLLQTLANAGSTSADAREGDAKGSRPGIFRPIIGSDGRFSTGLTQLAIWTIAVGTGLGFLLGRSMFEGIQLSVALPAETWDDYLILLGGPFAAAVLAKGIVTYKVDAGTLQKSEPAGPHIAQVATNDSGAVDLVDSQYLLFNVIALGYFVITLVNTAVLPTIPPTLLAMTSGTAALYVANKAAQRNAPSITSVSPRTAAPGDIVTILGGNFDPGDRADLLRRITLTISGYQRTIYPKPTNDTLAVFTVPADVPAGKRTLKLTSSAGVETTDEDIEILPSAVEIIEASPPYIQPGGLMTLTGRNFRTDLDPRVTVAGILASDARVMRDGKSLTFTVPTEFSAPPPENVSIIVSFPNLGDATHSLPLERPQISAAWRAASRTSVLVSATGWKNVPRRGRIDPRPR